MDPIYRKGHGNTPSRICRSRALALIVGQDLEAYFAVRHDTHTDESILYHIRQKRSLFPRDMGKVALARRCIFWSDYVRSSVEKKSVISSEFRNRFKQGFEDQSLFLS